MSLNSREFLIRKERDRVVGRLGQLASIFKVRLGLGEIEGTDREIELTIKTQVKLGSPTSY
jgi:hypothetical protein